MVTSRNSVSLGKLHMMLLKEFLLGTGMHRATEGKKKQSPRQRREAEDKGKAEAQCK